MAASVNGMLGYLTTVAIDSDASPAVATPLVEVTEVVPPNEQADDVEVTHYTSPNRTREYIAGFIESGEASVTMNRKPGSATEQRIMALQTSGAQKNVTITWPNGVVWVFLGHVKGYEVTAPIDDRQTATVTLKVDSAKQVTIPSPAP